MRASLFGLLPCAVVSLDTEGRITALNPRAERLLQVPSEQAIGKPYPDIFGASLANRLLGLFLRAGRAGPTTEPLLITATLPGGRVARLNASAGPVRDASGTVTGVMFVAEDLGDESPQEAQRAARLRVALERYAGPHVAQSVDQRGSFVQVGGIRQVVTVLHADVRGYTTLAETLEPERVADLLACYHSAAVDALLAHGGTFDHFIGDAVLAMWNAPTPQEDHAQRAAAAALAFQRAVTNVGDALQYGVGLHTGEAFVGNLGSERFMNYTAIGDTVNIAARLQSAAGPGQIVCSRAVLDAVGGAMRTIPLGALEVKGRVQQVEAYRVEGSAA